MDANGAMFDFEAAEELPVVTASVIRTTNSTSVCGDLAKPNFAKPLSKVSKTVVESSLRNLVQPSDIEARSTAAKKKRKKHGAKQGMMPAAPAVNITRGFQTPVVSGGEESDVSAACTPRVTPALGSPQSTIGSPTVNPSYITRVISNLSLQIDDSPRCLRLAQQDIDAVTASSSRRPSLDDGSNVSIDREFASLSLMLKPLPTLMEGELRANSPYRKMTSSDFEPLKCLGKGAFGTVLLVKQISTGRLFAQKQLKKASVTAHARLTEQIKSERSILESVNRHPFVVKLYYAFQDHHKLYLILEYAQGGELFHHLAIERTFSEETSAFYMAELVLALNHLHRHLRVIYRDLKPENCLLDSDGHLLLTDFGLSKVGVEDENSDGESRCNSVLGTVDYMAPEVILGYDYTAAVDWWSLGALGFDLLTGAPPFSSNNNAKTQQKIVHGKLNMPYYLSPDAKDLLTRLLRKEPKKRLGGNMPKDLSTIQSHRFFRRLDWKALERRELPAPIQPIITDPAEAENFSTEFTDLAFSPIETRSGLDWKRTGTSHEGGSNPFGGFSFVASSSLIDLGL